CAGEHVKKGGTSMKIDPVAVEQAGELMLIGMGGVFIVLFIIYIVAKLLLKFAPAKKAAK
ncbi:OadG family protein, partial [Lacticaseibacillus paracasei]|uniref:OadG family protein n=1 Tax=Lacticaseibacillus paracasei TaxID=1597 RepID=UPI003F7493A6